MTINCPSFFLFVLSLLIHPISAFMLPMPFPSASASASSSSASSVSCLPSPHFPPWPPSCHPPPVPSNFDPSLICWDFFQIASPHITQNSAISGEGQRQCPTNSPFGSIVSLSPPPKIRSSTAKFGGTTLAQKAAKNKSKSGANRRYKTPSPKLLRIRRENANARERKRMCLLNEAYEKLRAALSSPGNGQRLTKFETLTQAHAYITLLDGLLKDEKATALPRTAKSNSKI